jgi:hypothetical protein
VHLYFDRLVTAVTAEIEAHVVAARFPTRGQLRTGFRSRLQRNRLFPFFRLSVRYRLRVASVKYRLLPARSIQNRSGSSELGHVPAVAFRRPSHRTLPMVCRFSSRNRE